MGGNLLPWFQVPMKTFFTGKGANAAASPQGWCWLPEGTVSTHGTEFRQASQTSALQGTPLNHLSGFSSLPQKRFHPAQPSHNALTHVSFPVSTYAKIFVLCFTP